LSVSAAKVSAACAPVTVAAVPASSVFKKVRRGEGEREFECMLRVADSMTGAMRGQNVSDDVIGRDGRDIIDGRDGWRWASVKVVGLRGGEAIGD
jgi:hypothetical protein